MAEGSTDLAHQARRTAPGTWLRLTALALLCSLLALIAGTVLFARQAQRTEEQSARQVDLNVRLRVLQTVLVAVGDAETGQRGFLLTGRASYLAPYRAAAAKVSGLVDSLEAASAADPALRGRVPRLRALLVQKFDELAQTIDLQTRGQHDAALALVMTDAGQAYTAQLHQSVNAILDDVRAERDALNREAAEGSARSRRLAVATVSGLVVFTLLAAAQIAQLLASRRRYEAALADSEQRHRAIVEEQTEMISLAAEDGTLTYVNPAYSRHLHRDSEALIGSSLFDLVDAQDQALVRRQLRHVLDTGEARHGENRMVSPDGQELWIAWTNRCQTGPDGSRLLHSVGRDITARKHAEDAMRASEDFLARTSRVAGVGGWEMDLASGALHWSDGVRRIHEAPPGYTPTLESALAFYPPEARAEIERAVQAAREHGEPFDLELPLVTSTGRTLQVRAVGELERDKAGQPRRLVGAVQDITARKALEAQVAASERFVREITDNLPVRIAYLDKHRRFRFVNHAHCNRFGLPRGEILGRTREELTGQPTPPVVAYHLERLLQGQPQRFEYEEMVEGLPRQIESQLIPDFAPDGSVRGFYTTGIDITERKATERRLRDLIDIFDATPDFVVQTDRHGVIQYMNPAVRRALGFAADEPLGKRSFAEFNTPETNARFATEIRQAAERDGGWVGEATVYGAGRRVLPVNHTVIAHRDAAGRVARYSAIMRDISAELLARQQLQLQTATLGAIIEAIPAMVAVFDSDLRYRLVNKAFEHWKGVTRDKAVGRSAREVLGEADYERSLPWARRALAGETVSYEKSFLESAEHRHISVTYLPLRLEDGSIDGMIGIVLDITEHREKESYLLQLSERDPLTGLLNRAGFERFLTHEATDGRAASLALLYIDLDRFKPVNDQHGHPVGDELLRQFARRLQATVRPTDAVARLGGDEFAIVLSGIHEQANADLVADKVLEAATSAFETGGLTLHVGASVGVAFDASGAGGWASLVERADAQVYKAKAAGRGRRA